MPIFRQQGFHGDSILLKVVDSVIQAGIQVFVETGTEAGSTVAYVARMYPKVDCRSCEVNEQMYEFAGDNLDNHPNVALYDCNSVTMLNSLIQALRTIRKKEALAVVDTIIRETDLPTLFWLDAHSGRDNCPITEELDLIFAHYQSGFILIDDFQVPDDVGMSNHPGFGFDRYEGKPLGLEMVPQLIDNATPLWFPSHPSSRLPVYARGWVGAAFGNFVWEPPDSLAEKIWQYEG